jgi:2-polyprenyl-6-methoxyphenol hydroxylase-like FAD-dependent oxidoreductase
MTGFIDEPPRRTPVLAETQVLVLGGGSAGASAAAAAARRGADVILVERSGALGGLASGGLIILLLTLDDGNGQQVVGGLCQEITERMQARGGAYAPPREHWGSYDEQLVEHYRSWGLVWGGGPHRVRYSVAYDPEEFRFALNEMCTGAGVRLLFHSWACEAMADGERLRGAIVQTKSGRAAILAEAVIDATGDGDVLAAAGVPYEKEKVLPWLWFRMGGVREIDAAIRDGGWFFHTPGGGRALFPWGATEPAIRKIDATDPWDLSLAEVACRKMVMQEVDRLRREDPRFAAAYLCDIATQLGITESRRALGLYVLRREDADRTFEDAIALTGNWTKYGMLYAIPYRSLLVREFDNLLVAGRCISADHRAHHATKEIPPCMATGQAAGTAAALAVGSGVAPRALEVSALQARLREDGAILDGKGRGQ